RRPERLDLREDLLERRRVVADERLDLEVQLPHPRLDVQHLHARREEVLAHLLDLFLREPRVAAELLHELGGVEELVDLRARDAAPPRGAPPPRPRNAARARARACHSWNAPLRASSARSASFAR